MFCCWSYPDLRPEADFRSDCTIYHVVVQPLIAVWPISSFLQSFVSHTRPEEAGAWSYLRWLLYRPISNLPIQSVGTPGCTPTACLPVICRPTSATSIWLPSRSFHRDCSRGAGRVSGQGGQKFGAKRRKNFFVCPPWFSVCPPCHT